MSIIASYAQSADMLPMIRHLSVSLAACPSICLCLSFCLSACPSVCLPVSHTHTHTHPFNGPLSWTTQVSRYQKGKINLDFTEARDSEWQWHQLGHMQIYTSLQTNNHAAPHHSVFYRPDALPAAQPTVSKH